MKPFEAVLYGACAFLLSLLAALTLMLMCAEIFDFNEQLDNLWEKMKRWFKHD